VTRYALGAEELIELGQAVPPGALPAATLRQVSISRQEGDLLVRTVEAIVAFAKDFPLEFTSYCPMERWQPVLERVGKGVAEIERQLSTGAPYITVPADTVFSTVDLEECVTGARDARLSSAKTALILSAAGAAGQVLFGLTWLSLPIYIVSLAIVLGRPIMTRLAKQPAEPFRVGSGQGGGTPGMGSRGAFFIEYTGPRTLGAVRRAGPFPSGAQAVYHAERDAGFMEPGRDGGYVLFDPEERIVREAL